MFFLSGRTEKLVKSAKLEQVICENCHTKGNITLEIYKTTQKFLGFNFLPFMKQAYSECENCGQKHSTPILPVAIRDEFKVLRQGVGGVTIKDFTFFYAFAALIVVGKLWDGRHGEYRGYMHDQIREIELGDRIWFKSDGSGFDAWKIYKVDDEQLYIHPLIHKTLNSEALEKLDTQDKYDESQSLQVTRKELHEMRLDNKILFIKVD